MNKKQKGLTLVELLIVISIISILIGVILPNLNDVRKQARDKRRKGDIRAIQQALELYKNTQTTPAYPTTLPAPGTQWAESNVTYMNKIPKDPLYDAFPTPPNTCLYCYRYSRVSTDTYYLGTCLENTSDPEKSSNPPSGITDWGTCTGNIWYYVNEP